LTHYRFLQRRANIDIDQAVVEIYPPTDGKAFDVGEQETEIFVKSLQFSPTPHGMKLIALAYRMERV